MGDALERVEKKREVLERKEESANLERSGKETMWPFETGQHRPQPWATRKTAAKPKKFPWLLVGVADNHNSDTYQEVMWWLSLPVLSRTSAQARTPRQTKPPKWGATWLAWSLGYNFSERTRE